MTFLDSGSRISPGLAVKSNGYGNVAIQNSRRRMVQPPRAAKLPPGVRKSLKPYTFYNIGVLLDSFNSSILQFLYDIANLYEENQPSCLVTYLGCASGVFLQNWRNDFPISKHPHVELVVIRNYLG